VQFARKGSLVYISRCSSIAIADRVFLPLLCRYLEILTPCKSTIGTCMLQEVIFDEAESVSANQSCPKAGRYFRILGDVVQLRAGADVLKYCGSVIILSGSCSIEVEARVPTNVVAFSVVPNCACISGTPFGDH
jgi:hypothetical protein